ncbi:MAG TPA: GlsB/YeaQ/YmgE family stress response membrane protein [Vicinamibacteria bacterium]
MDLASTNFLVTLIIGGVIGWLASILMRTNAQMGILANVLVGVIGSFLGVAVANSLGMRAHTTPGSWVIAVLGAALLIAILRALGVFNRLASVR